MCIRDRNVIFLSVLCTFAMNSDVIIPVFARTVLGMGAGAYTRLLSAVGLGSLIGAVVMAGLARYGVRKWFLPAAAAGETIILIAMGLCRSCLLYTSSPGNESSRSSRGPQAPLSPSFPTV